MKSISIVAFLFGSLLMLSACSDRVSCLEKRIEALEQRTDNLEDLLKKSTFVPKESSSSKLKIPQIFRNN